jgi:choline dehydrogenase-like flavoprotein
MSFDYIVVGGGSAGCVVAGELAKVPSCSVLLLEHGAPAEEHPETLLANGYPSAFANDELMWERFTVPQAASGGRRLYCGTGRGLGGSGSVNGMVYTRGSRSDYDSWEIDGWRWKDVVDDFAALERALVIHRRNETEFTRQCIYAAEEMGFLRKEDFNDGSLCGYLDYEWMNYNGNERRSSYVSFLRPHVGKSNIAVWTRTSVRRLIIENGVATGVEIERNGTREIVRANRGVVMCGGALETPKLLLLSGLGPAPELRRHGIPIVRDIPGIGENLHDHPNVSLFYLGRREIDCKFPQLYGFHRADVETWDGSESADTCYVFYTARSSLTDAMVRMLPPVALPMSLYEKEGVARQSRRAIRAVLSSRRMQALLARVYGIVVILGKPKSRGTLRLTSSSANDPALIDPAYLTDPADLKTLRDGVDRAREMARSSALKLWGNLELHPEPTHRTDAGLDRFIRANLMTTFHFAGTCRMGMDELSVVDPELRVRGIRNLRIADASIIPITPVSALNAPSMMIGQRAARLIAIEHGSG